MFAEDYIVDLIDKVIGDYFRNMQTQINKLQLLTEKIEDKTNCLEIDFSEVRKKVRKFISNY